ncbi:MAG: methyltransferase family protein [Anaerolineae bacterium]
MWDRKVMLWGIALTLVFAIQIIGAIIFYNYLDNADLTNLGWAVMAVSGVFGWLPIFTFRKRGGVPKGKSYVETTQLVDTGIYAIVRHPQYLAGILLSVALMLIAPHWIVILSGIVVLVINYFSTVEEERTCIEQFGDAYREYMNRVPRFNALLGIVRWLRNTV